jgi:RNA polymerase sigma factor (sigma-70 family)
MEAVCSIPDIYASPVERGGSRGDDDRSFGDLTAAALAGDEEAWRVLCGQLTNVVWKTINGFQLGRHDAQDAFAATFFRLAEHLGDVRDPERLPGWVARTATHEVYGLLRSRRRIEPMADYDGLVADDLDPATALIRSELQHAVFEGLERLPERCRRLLRLLIAEPTLDYKDIGSALGVPHGTIGPTRRRCLDQLGRTPEVRPYLEGRSR